MASQVTLATLQLLRLVHIWNTWPGYWTLQSRLGDVS